METFRSRVSGLRYEERRVGSGDLVETVNGSDVVAALFPEYGNSSARPFLDIMGVGVVMTPSSGAATLERLAPGVRKHEIVRRYVRGDIVRVAELMDLAAVHGGMANAIDHLLDASRDRDALRDELEAAKSELCSGKTECVSCRHRMAVSEIYKTASQAILEPAEQSSPTYFNSHADTDGTEPDSDSPCLFKTFTSIDCSDTGALLRAAAVLNKTRCQVYLNSKDTPLPAGECLAVVTGVARGKNSAGDKDVVKLHMKVQRRPGEQMAAYTEALPVGKAMNVAVDKASSILSAVGSGSVAWTFDDIDGKVVGRPFMASFVRNGQFARMVNCKPFVQEDWRAAMTMQSLADER